MATLQEADVTCRFEAGIEADGIQEFTVSFTGRVDKANAVKSFLDPQIRAAKRRNSRHLTPWHSNSRYP